MKSAISIYDLRFFIGLITIFLASIYKPKRISIRLVTAVFILLIAFGLRMVSFYLSIVAANLVLLKLKGCNSYFFTIFNISCIYLFKIIGPYLESNISGTFDIRGILMILTVKMGYISISDNRSLERILDYIFFIPGLITGPIMPYSEFLLTNADKHVPIPWLDLSKTAIYLAIYLALRPFPFLNLIKSDDYSYLAKMTFLYLYNFGSRAKFHFAWNFGHCCFTLNSFPQYLNIDYFKVELTESVEEIAANWNRFVSKWLKTLFFTPLKSKSRPLAIAITYSASAALHGINACYFIFFLSFALYGKAVKRAAEFLHYKPLKQAQMVLFVSYFSMPFYLLSVSELYQIWKELYFIGHVYFTFWLLVYWLEKIFRSPPKIKTQ